ncbi:serine hydrolase domain-containing protein [Pseudomonas plecoglossicida]|uniref:Serine hydrolase n=1 Tax=Pseudomonas plecoglossicida TaxID=70775 RepID=A0AAD0VSK7_PSEDL|nr:serine hydrolase [Pseudomonas plecoglossicida]AXM96284.1 serine hydrolase [Pseudomonas plecoglossicida]EPB93287.1 beta-lactamase [Pseudomonas plecoglossicida NB2011]QLB57042.1 serine hydrolase [Pseudomonas plecoglossicida]
MLKTLLAVISLFAMPAWAEDWPDPDWPIDTVSSNWQSVDAYAFPQRNASERSGIRTDALLIIRDGRIVHERYSPPTTANSAHLTWSVSKSVLATVLGVAQGEGRFQLQDPAARFYPPMQAHPDVRLADLLHWASGLDWQEDYEYAPLKSSVVAMLYTRGRNDMAAYTAARPSADTPGLRFLYSSGDSNVLAAALRGMLDAQTYADYPWQALFAPLGITSAVWERDGTGTFVGSSYLFLTARDLARIGLLMQREGRWRDRQLLPASWIAFNRALFTRARAIPGEANPGGHWWLNQPLPGSPRPWPDVPADAFAALGHWGQALYVLPAQKLVIVRYGDDRGGSYRHDELLKRVLAALPREGT